MVYPPDIPDGHTAVLKGMPTGRFNMPCRSETYLASAYEMPANGFLSEPHKPSQAISR